MADRYLRLITNLISSKNSDYEMKKLLVGVEEEFTLQEVFLYEAIDITTGGATTLVTTHLNSASKMIVFVEDTTASNYCTVTWKSADTTTNTQRVDPEESCVITDIDPSTSPTFEMATTAGPVTIAIIGT